MAAGTEGDQVVLYALVRYLAIATRPVMHLKPIARAVLIAEATAMAVQVDACRAFLLPRIGRYVILVGLGHVQWRDRLTGDAKRKRPGKVTRMELGREWGKLRIGGRGLDPRTA